MAEDEQSERTRGIRDAAEGYALNNWRSLWPMLRMGMLIFAGVGLPILATALRLRGPAGMALVLAGAGCNIAVLVWMTVYVCRQVRDWRQSTRDAIEWARRGTGVAVEMPHLPRRAPRWLPLAYVAGPVLGLGSMWLAMHAAARYQPLSVAGLFVAVAALVAVTGVGRHRATRARPVHFTGMGLYCLYALAVAVGLPQPLADQPWGTRLLVTMVPVFAIQAVVFQLYSRWQLGRLQRILAAHPQEQPTQRGGEDNG